ncbi:AIPR protein [Enterocloster aldenensis]|uniref:AIPR family protein n=1 Tax=Enterocloster aldenensis TaxID=358742 RepID=UPI000E402CDD|nr:AIPR protein [Enterocloster aldenensis]
MYQKILEDIKKDYYVQNYPNDGQRFVAWYLRNIHNLDTIEAKDCITDGAGDKQIDAVYIDNQSSMIYIIQGKFYSGDTVNAEPLREVLSSWVQIKDLQKLQDAANEKLKVKINELAAAMEDDYEICFELITTSELTEDAKKDLAAFQKELAESDNLSANLVLVDNDSLKFKYDEAINRNRPYINHEFKVENGKYMELDLSGTKAVIVALPLKECIKIPGIKDGSLFRKNVRQSLGTSNKVNKGIAKTLKNDAKDFFFLHNGITAICSKINIDKDILSVKELNVVNGCQSLSTIYSCSESVRNNNDGYIMFRFYEISDSENADRISNCTNSQSAVKARDLRSNDKAVLLMKKAYEQCYTDGYFVTKRGETADPAKYNTNHIVNLTDLGKQLIAWHSQRPTISYSETKIFDKYFNQLFYKDYAPEKMQALNELYKAVIQKWTSDNPMGLNESLLAMKSYAPHHHLYAISAIVSEVNKMAEGVPDPAKVLKLLKDNGIEDTVVDMAGSCLNMAFENASTEATDNNRIFSPQNWIKAKGSLKDIRNAIRNQLATFKMVPGGKDILDNLNKNLKLSAEDFEARWTAD